MRLFYENLLTNQQVIDGAQGRNRTGTPVKARDFKSLASTNFATWAYSEWTFYYFVLLRNLLTSQHHLVADGFCMEAGPGVEPR